MRKLIIAILTAAAALCAAGCGDIKENSGSADNTSSAAETTAGPASAPDEFSEIQAFRDSVINGKTNVTEDNGCDLPSYSVTVIDDSGKEIILDTECKGWIEGSDRILEILKGHFKTEE